MPRKFTGSFEQLASIVTLTGARGHWQERLNGHYQFHSADGAVLNWWATTGTLSLQGSFEPAQRLGKALATLASASHSSRQLEAATTLDRA